MVPEISSATGTIFCHFGRFFAFCPPPPSEQPEKSKARGYIIILHMCTLNDSHMMYGSWDMERDGQNVLSFWTIFCLFTPLKKRKFKILNKMKKSLNISFYINVQKNHDHMLHCPEIRYLTDVILIFYFGLFFALLPP